MASQHMFAGFDSDDDELSSYLSAGEPVVTAGNKVKTNEKDVQHEKLNSLSDHSIKIKVDHTFLNDNEVEKSEIALNNGKLSADNKVSKGVLKQAKLDETNLKGNASDSIPTEIDNFSDSDDELSIYLGSGKPFVERNKDSLISCSGANTLVTKNVLGQATANSGAVSENNIENENNLLDNMSAAVPDGSSCHVIETDSKTKTEGQINPVGYMLHNIEEIANEQCNVSDDELSVYLTSNKIPQENRVTTDSKIQAISLEACAEKEIHDANSQTKGKLKQFGCIMKESSVPNTSCAETLSSDSTLVEHIESQTSTRSSDSGVPEDKLAVNLISDKIHKGNKVITDSKISCKAGVMKECETESQTKGILNRSDGNIGGIHDSRLSDTSCDETVLSDSTKLEHIETPKLTISESSDFNIVMRAEGKHSEPVTSLVDSDTKRLALSKQVPDTEGMLNSTNRKISDLSFNDDEDHGHDDSDLDDPLAFYLNSDNSGTEKINKSMHTNFTTDSPKRKVNDLEIERSKNNQHLKAEETLKDAGSESLTSAILTEFVSNEDVKGAPDLHTSSNPNLQRLQENLQATDNILLDNSETFRNNGTTDFPQKKASSNSGFTIEHSLFPSPVAVNSNTNFHTVEKAITENQTTVSNCLLTSDTLLFKESHFDKGFQLKPVNEKAWKHSPIKQKDVDSLHKIIHYSSEGFSEQVVIKSPSKIITEPRLYTCPPRRSAVDITLINGDEIDSHSKTRESIMTANSVVTNPSSDFFIKSTGSNIRNGNLTETSRSSNSVQRTATPLFKIPNMNKEPDFVSVTKQFLQDLCEHKDSSKPDGKEDCVNKHVAIRNPDSVENSKANFTGYNKAVAAPEVDKPSQSVNDNPKLPQRGFVRKNNKLYIVKYENGTQVYQEVVASKENKNTSVSESKQKGEKEKEINYNIKLDTIINTNTLNNDTCNQANTVARQYAIERSQQPSFISEIQPNKKTPAGCKIVETESPLVQESKAIRTVSVQRTKGSINQDLLNSAVMDGTKFIKKTTTISNEPYQSNRNSRQVEKQNSENAETSIANQGNNILENTAAVRVFRVSQPQIKNGARVTKFIVLQDDGRYREVESVEIGSQQIPGSNAVDSVPSGINTEVAILEAKGNENKNKGEKGCPEQDEEYTEIKGNRTSVVDVAIQNEMACSICSCSCKLQSQTSYTEQDPQITQKQKNAENKQESKLQIENVKRNLELNAEAVKCRKDDTAYQGIEENNWFPHKKKTYSLVGKRRKHLSIIKRKIKQTHTPDKVLDNCMKRKKMLEEKDKFRPPETENDARSNLPLLPDQNFHEKTISTIGPNNRLTDREGKKLKKVVDKKIDNKEDCNRKDIVGHNVTAKKPGVSEIRNNSKLSVSNVETVLEGVSNNGLVRMIGDRKESENDMAGISKKIDNSTKTIACNNKGDERVITSEENSRPLAKGLNINEPKVNPTPYYPKRTRLKAEFAVDGERELKNLKIDMKNETLDVDKVNILKDCSFTENDNPFIEHTILTRSSRQRVKSPEKHAVRMEKNVNKMTERSENETAETSAFQNKQNKSQNKKVRKTKKQSKAKRYSGQREIKNLYIDMVVGNRESHSDAGQSSADPCAKSKETKTDKTMSEFSIKNTKALAVNQEKDMLPVKNIAMTDKVDEHVETTNQATPHKNAKRKLSEKFKSDVPLAMQECLRLMKERESTIIEGHTIQHHEEELLGKKKMSIEKSDLRVNRNIIESKKDSSSVCIPNDIECKEQLCEDCGKFVTVYDTQTGLLCYVSEKQTVNIDEEDAQLCGSCGSFDNSGLVKAHYVLQQKSKRNESDCSQQQIHESIIDNECIVDTMQQNIIAESRQEEKLLKPLKVRFREPNTSPKKISKRRNMQKTASIKSKRRKISTKPFHKDNIETENNQNQSGGFTISADHESEKKADTCSNLTSDKTLKQRLSDSVVEPEERLAIGKELVITKTSETCDIASGESTEGEVSKQMTRNIPSLEKAKCKKLSKVGNLKRTKALKNARKRSIGCQYTKLHTVKRKWKTRENWKKFLSDSAFSFHDIVKEERKPDVKHVKSLMHQVLRKVKSSEHERRRGHKREHKVHSGNQERQETQNSIPLQTCDFQKFQFSPTFSGQASSSEADTDIESTYLSLVSMK